MSEYDQSKVWTFSKIKLVLFQGLRLWFPQKVALVQFIKLNIIHNILLQFNFCTAQNYKFLCLELEPPFFVWSRSRPNLIGVSSGTLGFRSRPKKGRLCITAFSYTKLTNQNVFVWISYISQLFCVKKYQIGTFFAVCHLWSSPWSADLFWLRLPSEDSNRQIRVAKLKNKNSI